MIKIGDKVSFKPKRSVFSLSSKPGPFEVTEVAAGTIRVKTHDFYCDQYYYRIDDFELVTPEETPQDLANKLRAAKSEMWRTAQKLREFGYKVQSCGADSVRSGYWSRPENIFKETTIKESL